MASKIHTVSLPEELSDYVENDPDLSLSKILQVAINKIMDNRLSDPLIARLQRQNSLLQKRIDELTQNDK